MSLQTPPHPKIHSAGICAIPQCGCRAIPHKSYSCLKCCLRERKCFYFWHSGLRSRSGLGVLDPLDLSIAHICNCENGERFTQVRLQLLAVSPKLSQDGFSVRGVLDSRLLQLVLVHVQQTLKSHEGDLSFHRGTFSPHQNVKNKNKSNEFS